MGISGHTSDGAVIAVMVVGTVLGAFTVIARMFTRTFVNHNAGWDDFFICVACVCLSQLHLLLHIADSP